MAQDFLPSKDADLVAWSANFSTLISAAPTAFGLTAPLATAYATLNTAWAAAYALAIDPGTRTMATVSSKNVARANLRASARTLARIVQGTTTVTPAQKITLGLNPRDTNPTPIPVPATAPDIDIVSVIGRTVKIRLHDVTGSPTRRGKPANVEGAAIFSCVGTTAPTDPAQWKFEGNTTRTTIDIVFANTVANGAQVWFTAFWYNPRAQQGPGTTPAAGTTLQGGSAVAA